MLSGWSQAHWACMRVSPGEKTQTWDSLRLHQSELETVAALGFYIPCQSHHLETRKLVFTFQE